MDKCPVCGCEVLLEGKIIISCLRCWSKLIRIDDKLVEFKLGEK